MNKSRVWLSSPHMGGSERKFIEVAFEENCISSIGANITEFEKSIKKYLNNNSHVGVVSSGTAAIHLGLILLGVVAGDEVLCQSMTFSASANPILYLGAIPVFIDSERLTWNLCPMVLEEAIIDRINKGKKPKAIIAVSLYGMPYQVEAVRNIANKYQIPILEDSAEALGSSYKTEKCGTFGDISIFSFNGNKIITTSGGGAIITKTKEQKDKAIFFATQSRDQAPHYQHSEIGYNYRMSNICAGIGRGQMEVLDNRILSRRSIHDFYVNLFKNITNVELLIEPNSDFYSNYWLTTIYVKPNLEKNINRESLRIAFDQANIETRPLWKPMHMQPIFKKYPFYGSNVASNLFENGLCLPSGSNLTDDEKNRIKAVVTSYFN